MKEIAIVTIMNDLHALAINKALKDFDDVNCHIIEVDRICGADNGLSWSFDKDINEGVVPTRQGKLVKVSELDVVWWRRVNANQKIPENISIPEDIDVINNDSRASLRGVFLSDYSGKWISHPNATTMAENKLVQLSAAKKAGFTLPSTLVSQNPKEIKKFCELHNNHVVIKPVRGSKKAFIFTQLIHEEHLQQEHAMKLCPAIYQEYIPGNQHIRAQVFGDSFYASLLTSSELDWRGDLRIPFEPIELDEDIKNKLQKVLKLLKLEMGIFDLKINEEGQIIWLEINPQGQFLFVEPLADINLTSAFASFLYESCH